MMAPWSAMDKDKAMVFSKMESNKDPLAPISDMGSHAHHCGQRGLHNESKCEKERNFFE